MEKKDTFFLLLVLGAGAYGVHRNWDVIRTKLSLDEMRPGLVRALQIAKEARTFDGTMTNTSYLKARADNREITVPADPWQGTEVDASHFRVTCSFLEAGEPRVHVFAVDIGSGIATHEGLDQGKPAPR